MGSRCPGPFGVTMSDSADGPAGVPTPRQIDVLAAYVEARGSIPGAASMLGIRPATAKRHLADLRVRCRLSTEELIYVGRAFDWFKVAKLEAMTWRIERPIACGDRATGSELVLPSGSSSGRAAPRLLHSRSTPT